MTAAENIELPLIYQKIPREERKERWHRLLKRFVWRAAADINLMNCPEDSSRELPLPGQLHPGRLFSWPMSRPAIWILQPEKEIMELFHGLHRQGSTIVLITHDDSIARQADRSVHILDGKIREVAR